jgi:tRNA nucleotidyltransferase (CCA-adding enzyme)
MQVVPTLFKKAIPLLNKIEQAGYEAYFVGGSVRDYLMDRQINDVDIATSAFPSEVKEIFPHTVDVGIEHGTVLVLENGEEYEITTFRTESEYNDYRRPEAVKFIRSLVEDLKRRDFTMNSIAMDISGEIHDPFNGYEDIQSGVIRSVGSAKERFSEDALRMMRAVRFVSQLGFALEMETNKALAEHHSLLKHIAIERITQEFEKLLSGQNKQKALEFLLSSNLYNHLPGLSGKQDSLIQMISLPIHSLTSAESWLLLLYLIQEEQPNHFLNKWRLSTKMIKSLCKDLTFLQERLGNDWSNYSVYCAGLPAAHRVENVYSVLESKKSVKADYITAIYESLPITNRSELNLTGNDLLQWTNRKPGRWIKQILDTTEKSVINGEIQNEKNAIREWLHRCKLI